MHNNACVLFAISKFMETANKPVDKRIFNAQRQIYKHKISFTYSCIADIFNIYFEPVICATGLSICHVVQVLEHYNALRNNQNKRKGYFNLGVRVKTSNGISHFVIILCDGQNIIFIDNQIKEGISYYKSISEFSSNFAYKVDTVCIQMHKGEVVYHDCSHK